MKLLRYALQAGSTVFLGAFLLFPQPIFGQAPPCPLGPGTWETRAPLPIEATEVAAAAIGARVYVLGGLLPSGGSTNRLFIYDAITDNWSEGAPLPIPGGVNHANFASAATFSDRLSGRLKLFFLGGLLSDGSPTGRTFEYDPDADIWTERTTMPTARGAAGTVEFEGSIYVGGGLGSSGSLNALEVFGIGTNRWTQLPPMPTARDHLTAARPPSARTPALPGYAIHFIGGRNGSVLSSANEAFDITGVSGTWHVLVPLPTPRAGLAATGPVLLTLPSFPGGPFAGSFYIVGGEGSAIAAGTFKENEMNSGPWCSAAPMPAPRHGLMGATLQLQSGGPAYPTFFVSGGPRSGATFSNVNEVFFPPATVLSSSTQIGVFNAASYTPDLAPGSLTSLFASSGLTYTPNLSQPHAPFPTQWNGTRVLLNGQPAPLIYVSPTQVNFLVPRDTSSPVKITVNRGSENSASIDLPLFPAAPALFSLTQDGHGQGAILHNNTPDVASVARPARIGEILEIYLTGLNSCDSDQLCTQVVPEVTIGSVLAPVVFAGRAPCCSGLDQINVRVPPGVASSPALPVRVTHFGHSSNEVTIAVQ